MQGFRPLKPSSETSATQDPGSDESTGREWRGRQKLTLAACQACQRRKSKCSGDRPTCRVCKEKQTECMYDVSQGQTRVTTLKSRVRDLSEENDRMAAILNALRSSSESRAQELLTQIRSGVQKDPTSPFPTFSEPNRISRRASFPTLWTSLHPDPGYRLLPTVFKPLSKLTHRGLGEARPVVPRRPIMDEYGWHFGWKILDSNPPMTLWLPRQAAAKSAIFSFYESNSHLFHVSMYSYGNEILDTVYNQGDVDAVGLAEMFAIIAAGSQNTVDKALAKLGHLCYEMSRSIIDDILEAQSLPALRILTFWALYHAMKRRSVALWFTQLGLAVASQHGFDSDILERSPERRDDERLQGKRMWRVLVGLDMWLSTTLGRLPTTISIFHGDTPLVISTIVDLSDMIQSQTLRLMVLTARLTRALFMTGDAQKISEVAQQVYQWYCDLPRELHPSKSPPLHLPLNVEMSVYILQLLYTGTLMLLYRRIVLHSHLSGPGLSTHAMGVVDQGLQAARHVAGLIKMFLERDIVIRRHWLINSSCSIAGAILLERLVQELLSQDSPSVEAQQGQQELLNLGRECVKCLVFCADSDSIAEQMSRSLQPHLTTLERALVPNGVSVLRDDLERVSTELQAHLRTPFAAFLDLEIGVEGWERWRSAPHQASSVHDPQSWWLEVPSPYNWPSLDEQPPSGLDRMMATLQAEL